MDPGIRISRSRRSKHRGHSPIAGGLARYRKGFEQSLAMWQKKDDQPGLASARWGLGGLLLQEADFSGARKMYDQALAIRTSRGDKIAIAETQLGLRRFIAGGGAFSSRTGKPRSVSLSRFFRHKNSATTKPRPGASLPARCSPRVRRRQRKKRYNTPRLLAAKEQESNHPLANRDHSSAHRDRR